MQLKCQVFSSLRNFISFTATHKHDTPLKEKHWNRNNEIDNEDKRLKVLFHVIPN